MSYWGYSVEELLDKISRKRKQNGSNNHSRDNVEMINNYINDCLDSYITKYPNETANEDDDEYAIYIKFRK